MKNNGIHHLVLNNKLLSDFEYIKTLSNEIKNWNLEHEMMADKCLVWELIKYNIRNFTIRYNKNKVKDIRCNESKLERANGFRT